MLLIPHIDPELAKSLILMVPAIGLGIAWVIMRPSYYQRLGIMLGLLWNIAYLSFFNIVAQKQGWWYYAPSQNTFYNIPVEIILGWAIFWGGLFPCLFGKIKFSLPGLYYLLAVMCAFLIDLFLMPQLTTLFSLGQKWLTGELILLISCLLPALVIYQLTVSRKAVGARAILQSIIWGGWMLFLIPAVLFTFENIDIFSAFSWSGWKLTLFINTLGFAAFLGLAALHEFATAGNGTPIPFDPPLHLVTTGPYAYVANPLQISTMLMFIILAIFYQSTLMIAPIGALLIYSTVFVRWHHQIDIEKRFGKEWFLYKDNVRNWWPRWTPYICGESSVFISKDCEICQDTEIWMKKLQPSGVNFIPATTHPSRDLERVSYLHHSQRFEADGIRAIARVFEHTNLLLAMFGWFMRLPIINRVIQILTDGSGARGEKVKRSL